MTTTLTGRAAYSIVTNAAGTRTHAVHDASDAAACGTKRLGSHRVAMLDRRGALTVGGLCSDCVAVLRAMGDVARITAADLQVGDYLWRTPVGASVQVAALRHMGGGTVVVNPRAGGAGDAYLAADADVIVTRWTSA